jgi:hypothetical protein
VKAPSTVISTECVLRQFAGLEIQTQTPFTGKWKRSWLPVSWLFELAFPVGAPSNCIHPSDKTSSALKLKNIDKDL